MCARPIVIVNRNHKCKIIVSINFTTYKNSANFTVGIFYVYGMSSSAMTANECELYDLYVFILNTAVTVSTR
jgi:hypothetical protein